MSTSYDEVTFETDRIEEDPIVSKPGRCCRCRHCCNKFLRLLPSLLVTKAFWLSLVSLGVCDLAKVITITGEDSQGNAISREQTFGLWSYLSQSNDNDSWEIEELIRECTFPLDANFIMDSKFRAARACGVLAVAVGGAVMIVLWAMTAFDSVRISKIYKPLGGGLVLCCLFEGLTLLFLRGSVCNVSALGPEQNVVCTIAEGGSTIITACAFWFATGLTMMLLPAPESDPEFSVLKSESDSELSQHRHQLPPVADLLDIA